MTNRAVRTGLEIALAALAIVIFLFYVVSASGQSATPQYMPRSGGTFTGPITVPNFYFPDSNHKLSSANLFLGNANLVCPGDSITAGADNSTPSQNNFCYYLQSLSFFSGRLTTYNNSAVAGWGIANLIADYTAHVKPYKPTAGTPTAILSVYINTNDIGACNAASTFASDLSYWQTAQADGFFVMAYTIPHRIIGDSGCAETTRQALNDLIRASPVPNMVIDVDDLVYDPSNTTWFNCVNVSTDCGTHPTVAWHQALAAYLDSRLRAPIRKPQQNAAKNFPVWANTSGTTYVTDYFSTRYDDTALRSETTGIKNAAYGYVSLAADTTGSQNTAVGYGTLGTNATGSDNTCIGYVACIFPTAQSQNTAVGSNDLSSASLAVGQATAVGYNALAALQTGTHETAVGALALLADTTGGNNTALGWAAGNALTTANFNTFLGTQAGQGVNADSNIAIGYQAMLPASTATKNVIIGNLAGNFSGSASQNVALGWDTLAGSTSASDNTCLGYVACQNATGGQNTAVGSNALKAGSNTGTQNTAAGYGALQANTTGATNVALGYLAGSLNTTGSGNVDLGGNALSAAGVSNTAQIGAGTNPTSNTAQFQNWNLVDSSGNTHANLTVLAVGSPIASAATIAPITPIVHITGTAAIANITVPTVAVGGGTFTGCVSLVPDAVWTTTAAGNIALASTAVINRVLTECYDGSKWYPSY